MAVQQAVGLEERDCRQSAIVDGREEIRHRIRAGQDDDFFVRNQADVAEMADQTGRVMTMLLASIASVLPAAALADLFRAAFGAPADIVRSVVVLGLWGVGAVVVAATTFSWD